MKRLHDWFLANKRDFPWRQERTPYRVWVSEIMLQQTRASVVIPYFLRWMELFPTVEALARAPLEKVIKAWEGLGYYSRARLLHQGACQIVEEHRGEIFPEALSSIRGIGPYTRGAILSFGFQKRAPAVDGNVMRVMSRLQLIEENISRASVKKKIEDAAAKLLDEKEPWVTAEALIELGATICVPKPRCSDCPLSSQCLAKRAGKEESLPIKNKGAETTLLYRLVCVFEAGRHILVKKGAEGQVMADLYEFPYLERKGAGIEKAKALAKTWGLKIQAIEPLSPVAHTFTRFKAHLSPYLIHVETKEPVEGHEWVLREEFSELPFSSGHRKIAQSL